MTHHLPPKYPIIGALIGGITLLALLCIWQLRIVNAVISPSSATLDIHIELIDGFTIDASHAFPLDETLVYLEEDILPYLDLLPEDWKNDVLNDPYFQVFNFAGVLVTQESEKWLRVQIAIFNIYSESYFIDEDIPVVAVTATPELVPLLLALSPVEVPIEYVEGYIDELEVATVTISLD